MERHEYGSFYNAKETLHRSIGFIVPQEEWKNGYDTTIPENLSNKYKAKTSPFYEKQDTIEEIASLYQSFPDSSWSALVAWPKEGYNGHEGPGCVREASYNCLEIVDDSGCFYCYWTNS